MLAHDASTVICIHLTLAATPHIGETVCFLFVAVKFGRMSKRQREMVQDEVKYHKRNRSVSSDSTGSGSDTDLTDS